MGGMTCSLCDNKHYARGFCHTHYWQLRDQFCEVCESKGCAACNREVVL